MNKELRFLLWKTRWEQKLELMNVCACVFVMYICHRQTETKHWLSVLVSMPWPLSKGSSNQAMRMFLQRQ